MSAKPRLTVRTAFVSVAVVPVFAVAALAAFSGTEATARQEPGCGDTITVDTTLDSDLVDCPNNGIVIGADDVTLDLNGHTVSGDGKAVEHCPRNEFCDVGVLNFNNDGVRVKHGTVRDFAFGPWIARGRDSRVVDVSSKRNTIFGFVVSQSAQVVIRDSSGDDNIPPEGDGIGLFGSDHVQILDSSFRHNAGPGIHVIGENNVIKGNRISHNSPGILMGGEEGRADRNRVRRNHLARNDAGIIIGPGSQNVIARNHLSKDGDGIAIEKGRGNLVERNVVVGARNDGIYLGLDAPPIGGVDNVVRRNEVRGSGEDGFTVRKKDNHSVLRRNFAGGAGDDGFDVQSRSTKLTRNRAVHNGDLGIKALPGVIDGGGNRAAGNRDARQCVNVRCR